LLYVLAAVVVPIALMCATLTMERFERRVLGPPVHTDEDRGGASTPQPSTVEHHIVAEPPRAA
jgi:hypothetical protein